MNLMKAEAEEHTDPFMRTGFIFIEIHITGLEHLSLC